MRKLSLFLSIIAAAAVIAAIAIADDAPGPMKQMAAHQSGSAESTGVTGPAPSARKGTVVKLRKSRFGQMLTDRKGLSLYLYDYEKSKRSKCYGACAKAWPPLLTKGKPRAGKGINARLLGTTKRRNGKRQVTYNGHPLYYYEHEDEPGEVLCHNVFEFDGLWLVVDKKGNALP